MPIQQTREAARMNRFLLITLMTITKFTMPVISFLPLIHFLSDEAKIRINRTT
jgi:hypothetical protein